MERGGRGEVSSAIFTINVPFSCGESSGQYYIFIRPPEDFEVSSAGSQF